MAACEHVEEVRHDLSADSEPVCEDCARAGEDSWVSLRQCMTCGHVGCCDSSPGKHATAHHRGSSHPMVQTLQPGQDWVWCYVDEKTMRNVDGRWIEVDLFYEAGIAYMREHVDSGGEPDVGDEHIHGKGFPLGRWVGEMRRRESAGELSDEQREAIGALPGWRWG
jgi:Zn-finger in ubiquitin-hydrolases and other protein